MFRLARIADVHYFGRVLEVLLSERTTCQILFGLQDWPLKNLINAANDVSLISWSCVSQTYLSQLTSKHGVNSRSLNLFMTKVARQRGILPASVYLGHIDNFDRRPVCGGGFSDIYMGEYNQQLVALKVLRMFGEDNTSILQVTQKISLL